jgi:hypothetical protein
MMKIALLIIISPQEMVKEARAIPEFVVRLDTLQDYPP